MIPGVTLILNGCGLGAKGSDEIGRIGANLSTTNTWTSDEVQQDEARIQWKDLCKTCFNRKPIFERDPQIGYPGLK